MHPLAFSILKRLNVLICSRFCMHVYRLWCVRLSSDSVCTCVWRFVFEEVGRRKKFICSFQQVSSKMSPISMLQELMVAAQKPLPIYHDEGNINGLFQCTVHVDGISASGRGRTKKAAKHASAEQALMDLDNETGTSNRNESCRNYVGELNEYASTAGYSFPIYTADDVRMNTQFVITCTFLGRVTHGVGANKKTAKKDSAKKMLEKIRTGNPPVLHKDLIATPKKINTEINDSEKKILNDLTFQNRPPRTTCAEKVRIPGSELSVDRDSLEDLENALKSCSIKFDVKWMQCNPYIICVSIKDTSFNILGAGETKNQALKKAYKDLLLIEKSDCFLNDQLFQ